MRLPGKTSADAINGAFPHDTIMHRNGGSLPRTLARLLVALILILAPWLFGATEQWALAILQSLTLLAVLLSLFTGTATWNWSWGGPVLAVAVYLALQAANPSHRYDPTDRSLAPQSHIAWLPHTADALATWQTLAKFLTYAGLFWVARGAFTERHHAWQLLTALVVSGFVMAVVGLTQKLSGTGMILGLRKGGFFFFGPFVNRNNYASYINLLLPAALAVVHHRRHVAIANQERSDAGPLFGFMALVMVLSIVFTTSRAGTVIGAGLLLAWGVVETFRVIRTGTGVRRMLLIVVLAASALIIGLWYLDANTVKKRLGEMRDVPAEIAVGGGRGAAYQATWKMFRDHWFYGVGGGTFAVAYPYYSIERMDWFRRYAHNDWLQYLAELGVVGAGCLVLLAFGVFRAIKAACSMRGREDGQLDWIAIALGLGLTGVALHALVDFPMHIPGVATLAIVYVGLLTVPGVWRHHETH